MSAIHASLRWVILAFAVLSLVFGAALGMFTAQSASRPPCAGDLCTEVSSNATTLAWTVLAVSVVGVVLAVGAATAGARGPKWLRYTVSAMALAAALEMALAYMLSDFDTKRQALEGSVPYTQLMWILPPTLIVGVVGVLALAVAVIAPPPRPSWRPALAGIAVGLGAAVAFTTTQVAPALSKPTDSDFVAHTTAPAADIPPFPARLGQQRFTVSLPDDNSNSVTWRTGAVVAGGVGFVTLRALPETGGAPALVAYDAAGNQRWYYSRTGPLPLTNFGIFDDGSVVIADASSDESALLVGLDAVTGEPLWTSNDPLLSALFEADHSFPWRDYRPFLVDRGEDHWTSFDPRTGRQSWRIPNPLRCPDGQRPIRDDTPFEPLSREIGTAEFYHVDSSERLINIVDCSTSERLDLQEIVIAPATGEVLSQRPAPVSVPDRLRGTSPDSWFVQHTGANGYTIDLSWQNEPANRLEVLVDTTSERTVVLDDGLAGRDGFVWVGPTGADGGFVVVNRDNTVRTFSGVGEERCGFAPPPTRSIEYLTVLGDEIVYILDDFTIGVVRRADCEQTARLPLPAEYRMGINPIRGATLIGKVPSEDNAAVTVFGYS